MGSFYEVLRTGFPRDLGIAAIETGDGRSWTYRDLEQYSGKAARLLLALGAGRGERVVAHADTSPESLGLYLACLRAGAVYVPLARALRGAEIEGLLNDAAPRVAVVAPDVRDQVHDVVSRRGDVALLTLDASGRGSLTDRSAALAEEPGAAPVRADEVAALMYTSGTTGRPKGAMLTHGNLAHNALALARAWDIERDDVLLHALPLHHVHGLFVACHTVLARGARMILLPRFDVARVVDLLPKATVLMGVPTFYTRLLGHPGLTARASRGMRLFTSGSAPLRVATARAFTERTGHHILERYGMTETLITFSNPLVGERRPGTVGFPLPGVEHRVVDESGGDVATGASGRLEVRGPSVSQGYWRQPEQTARAFRSDGFFVTGDLAQRDDTGYLSIVGRTRDLIITGGENVSPGEVEVELDGVAGVAESAVLGLPHPDWGEAVVAVVVKAPDAETLSAESITARIDERLAGFKVPKRIFFVSDLPRNAMGKVQKHLLRARFEHTFEPAEDEPGSSRR